MDTNTTFLIEKLGNQLDSYIQTAANKAGAGVEHFWPILVKQQIMTGYIHAGLSILFALILLYLWLLFFKNKRRMQDEYTDTFDLIAILCFASAIYFLIFCASISNTITKITNPEYHALQSVIKSIK